MRCHQRRLAIRLAYLLIVAGAGASRASIADFNFDCDTLAFANTTVFEYRDGAIYARSNSANKEQTKSYTRRCFVMSRTVVQFHKFARFDPRGRPLNDKELAAALRRVTRRHPWDAALPEAERIVFPGYANLREMSKARGRVLQDNIGLGWPTYARIGNFRMFFLRGERYQERTHQSLNAALDDGDFFIGYLSSYPWYTINHAVLIYARKPGRSNNGIEHYLAYDPNHPEAPRELKWSSAMRIFNYQKDEEFVGGYTRVYQIYSKWLQ